MNNDEDNEIINSSPFLYSNQPSQSEMKQIRNRNRRSLPAQIHRRSSTLPVFDLTSASPHNRNLSLRLSSSPQNQSSINQKSLLNYLSRELIENSEEKSNYSNENLNDEQLLSNLSSNINEINIEKINKTSDYDSGESPNSSDYNSDTDKLQLKVVKLQK